MSSCRVAIEGVSLDLGASRILREVDLVLEKGKLTALLGPSGAGKTTLLKVLAGLERPCSGRVRAGDLAWSDAATGLFVEAAARGVGLVFQSYALWPHLSAFENAAFPLRVRRVPQAQIEARVAAAFDLVRLPRAAQGREPAGLSGGEQQRVALARALVYEPALLLLDEPLANLDAPNREDLRADMRRLQRRTGVTALYVTHDQGEALAMADQLAVMDGGRIVETGEPRALYERADSALVARFLGARNELRGVRRGGAVVLEGGVTLEEPAPEGARDGEAVVALLRPDELELAVPGSGRQGWEGEVASVEFAGDRVRVGLEGGVRLAIDVPASCAPVPGQRVVAVARPGRARIYPA
ncbi:MAG: ABC transporter ATP-binding protein [Elusimicrobia bacterium]|nr:ABC transporter ATP-binding protein [Elusimicrobiota bacterium]